MSPTISLEAIFALLIIDAHESISVHTFDVPGAYPHTSLPDDKVVHIKFKGKCLEIMCEVNPEYGKFVTYEKGKKVLYLIILKLVYGMIYSALIWYDLFYATISGLGFKLNIY